MTSGALVQGRDADAFGSRLRSPSFAKAVNFRVAGLVY